MMVMYGPGPIHPKKREPPGSSEPFVGRKLVPCAKCNRHIVALTECPFCFQAKLQGKVDPKVVQQIGLALAKTKAALQSLVSDVEQLEKQVQELSK